MNNLNETKALNILSLEDSIFDFEIISEKLMGAGYHINISRVEKETAFLSSIQSNSYDIVLADYNLPNFDAFQALEIRNQYYPEIPFICVSGSIGEILAIELLKKGADDYVLKDRLERLPFAIKRALADAKERNKRKEAEEALRKSEERLRDILFSTADWVWEIDEKLKFTYTSQSGLDLLKVSEDEVIGKTPFDFMLPDEAKRVLAILNDLITNREPIKDLENWIVGKDGSTVCLLINGVSIINANEQFKGFRGVGKDITERKLSENAIRQSEAELNYAQEIGNMGSWHHHLPTNKYKHSRNLARILGIEPEDEENGFQIFLNHIHPDDRQLIDLHVKEIADTQNEVSYELRYILDNGDIIWLQNNIRPTFNDGKLTDLHGVMIDITEKKKNELDLIKAKEKAEASDKLKTSFINNISHEIRTPLNGILGFTEVLTDPNLPTEEKNTYLAMLYNSSDRLINTVTNFLDISLLTSGNQLVYKKEIELKSLMEQTIEKFKGSCLTKKLTLSLEIPEDEQEIRIITDKDILEKILYQLIDNAIKFTSEGSITLGYKTNDDEMLFFVRDTGIGIQPESQKQIFESFMQENTANTRGYEGSGLGLPIAKGFVELLGGRIWLDSEKGIGTTFYFFIPLEQKIGSGKAKSPEDTSTHTRHKQTVLVAEDDETNFFYINILLKNASINILHAWNGIEAVELCRDHSEVELVLMDLKMPEMDGFEATMHIKAFRPDLPVIAVSAYMSSEDKHRAIIAGCDEFITKPIRKELLLKKVEENGRLTS
ncbi:MAG: response regulator [Verrucomicrobia bacterium]|nr:response regulator [Prolixibacteraceae bacterium]